MKEKISWLDKPWTTRGYLKVCGIVYLIYLIVFGWWYIKSIKFFDKNTEKTEEN